MLKTLKSSRARTVLAMRLLCFTLWGTIFISGQYLTIHLSSFPFISDYEIGMLMSCGSFLAALSQMISGRVADRSKTKNTVLLFAIAVAGIGQLLLVLPAHTGFLTLLPCVFILQSFNAIPCMMTDTIVVENVDKAGVPYGMVKCFSSAGAAAMAFVLFLISLRFEVDTTRIYIIAGGSAALSFAVAMFMPPTKGHAYGLKGKDEKTSMKAILKNGRLMLLLCYLLLMFIGVQSTNVFMGVYFATDAGMNAGLGFYGLFFAVCIGSETLFMTLGSRLIQRMNIYHVFYLVGAVSCARSLVWYLAPNVYVLLLNAVCQALLFAPLWTRLGPYVYSIVDKEMRATGQAACGIMTGGVAPMIGSMLAGMIAGSSGIRNVFGVMAVMLLVVVVVFYFLFKRERAVYEGMAGGGSEAIALAMDADTAVNAETAGFADAMDVVAVSAAMDDESDMRGTDMEMVAAGDGSDMDDADIYGTDLDMVK